ncbi:MAG: hypothetical protein GWO24_37360 [Akkermansiaceae bacterium]|nr:hypothetical protein [Akkermansiaceae bacterium]
MIRKTLTIAMLALAGAFAAPRAEAGHSHVSITIRSGYASCGCPYYSKRYFRGYDCYRRPVYHYTRLPIHHGSSCRHHARHHRHHYSPPCHPPVYHRTRSGFVYRPRVSIHAHRGYSRSYSRGRSCR